MTGHESAADWVWLARIRRPQGRKGEVFADILTDFPEKFAQRKRLWLISASETETRKGGPEPPKGEPETRPEPPMGEPEARKSGLETRKGGTSVPPQLTPKKDPGFSPCAAPRQVELVHHWQHKGGIVLHFAGIDSISEAETLAGRIVAVPRAERAELAEDEVYIADLIGCALVDVAADPPRTVGEIENVERGAGPVSLLIVKGARGEVLVPFAKSYLRKMDVENKRVEMALPEGLVELNEAEKG
ncbi:MAG TPA: ribosome maturation factor RimM [Terracidiphilus sp.]|jgi:16S rRNA processing protein RimM|nr:ribosome maturation factor RimM [Terracidiphilus sp.]